MPRIRNGHNKKFHKMRIDCGCATCQYNQWTSNHQLCHTFSIQITHLSELLMWRKLWFSTSRFSCSTKHNVFDIPTRSNTLLDTSKHYLKNWWRVNSPCLSSIPHRPFSTIVTLADIFVFWRRHKHTPKKHVVYDLFGVTQWGHGEDEARMKQQIG